jgi:hypothetical protein
MIAIVVATVPSSAACSHPTADPTAESVVGIKHPVPAGYTYAPRRQVRKDLSGYDLAPDEVAQ